MRIGKSSFFFVSIMIVFTLFWIFISPMVFSEEPVEDPPIEPVEDPPIEIGTHDATLNTKMPVCDDWNVEFIHMPRQGAYEVFNISIQNLQDSRRAFNLTQILEPLNYDTANADVSLYTWESELLDVVYDNYTLQLVEHAQNYTNIEQLNATHYNLTIDDTMMNYTAIFECSTVDYLGQVC